MYDVAKNESNDVNVEKAIKRMQTHSSKTKVSFAKSLKVKAPKSTYGRLAGPANS
ncbi:hypothetical protein ACP3V5_17260 [Vibrio maritimus]